MCKCWTFTLKTMRRICYLQKKQNTKKISHYFVLIMGLDSKWVTQVTLVIRLKVFNGKLRQELFGGRMGSWTTGQPQKQADNSPDRDPGVRTLRQTKTNTLCSGSRPHSEPPSTHIFKNIKTCYLQATSESFWEHALYVQEIGIAFFIYNFL